jgi:hypothetical protein
VSYSIELLCAILDLSLLVLWDPDREDKLLLHRSALLHAHFYVIQMTIHRPFVDSADTTLSLPDLAICTNAARSCAGVIDAVQRRSNKPLPYHIVRFLTTLYEGLTPNLVIYSGLLSLLVLCYSSIFGVAVA